MQKTSLFHLLVLQIQSILESCHQTGHTHFWPWPPPQKVPITFWFPACKTTVNSISLVHTLKFRVQRPDWPYLLLTMPNQNIFDQLCEFVSTCKKCGCFIALFWRNRWFKTLQSDWLRAFWSITKEKDFSQRQDLSRNTANNMNFHYRTNSV